MLITNLCGIVKLLFIKPMQLQHLSLRPLLIVSWLNCFLILLQNRKNAAHTTQNVQLLSALILFKIHIKGNISLHYELTPLAMYDKIYQLNDKYQKFTNVPL